MRKNAFESLVLLVRGFWLVLSSSPFLTPIIIILTLLASLEPITHLVIMKLLVDRLAAVAAPMAGTPFADLAALLNLGSIVKVSQFGPIMFLLAVQFGIWVVGRALRSVQDICSTRARMNFELHVQTKIMRKCAELDLAFFENSANLDQLERAMRGSAMSAWNLVWMLFSLIGSMLTMSSYLIVLFTLHPWAPLIVAIATAPQMISAAHFSRARWKTFTDQSSETRLRHYIAWLVGDKHAAKELKLFGLSDYLIERYRYFCNKHYETELKLEKKSQLINFFLGALSNVGTIGLWVFILLRATLGMMTPGDAFLHLSATENSRHYFLSLFSGGGRLYEHILFLSELFVLLDRKAETVEGALTGMAGPGSPRWGVIQAPDKLQHGIEFKNVTFSYPGSEVKVLDGVSMFLPADKSVALVGKNGAGKTTLVKLLVRLYDPLEGEILVDGRNIKEYDIHSLRKMYSVVFQDYLHYYLTMRENIGFGDIEKVNDTAQVMWAAQQAGAHEIADKLELKYETYLGRHYGIQNSVDLSGGEWQKIGLARTFMREAPVVILDEPTASLDAFAEAELFETFEGLKSGRLSVIISHRFSTVKVATLIMVLDNGKLIESGSHDELVAQGGVYSQMYNAQADRYK